MTAKDLLHQTLDYKCQWDPYRKHEKPSKIRRSQITSLQDAFGLSKKYVNPLVQITYSVLGKKEELTRAKELNKLSNLEYLMHGEFLHDRPHEKNKELSDIALTKVKELFGDIPKSRMNRPVDIGWMFNNLMDFRINLYKIAYPDEGMTEGFSVGLYYSIYLKGQLKKIINENVEEIDDTLWMILDPEKRAIEMDILVKKYKYQDVDLKKIDLEWEMENP